nr:hypothetical protein [Tanacetum cinerariifolium]
MCEMVGKLIQKKQEEKQIQEDQAVNAQYSKIPAYYDDDDNYNFAITPNETIDSLIMGDEHLDTTNQHHFNAESDLVESMLNRDSSTISSSSKIDSLLDEFAGELTLLKSIPPGIDKTECHPENEIRLSQRLLYDYSSSRPSEEFNSENSNAEIESFSPSPIHNEDSDSFMEKSIYSLLRMTQCRQALRMMTMTLKGIIFFEKDCFTMILFPFRTLLTSQMSSEFFFPSSPICIPRDLKTLAKGFYPPSLNFLSFN